MLTFLEFKDSTPASGRLSCKSPNESLYGWPKGSRLKKSCAAYLFKEFDYSQLEPIQVVRFPQFRRS